MGKDRQQRNHRAQTEHRREQARTSGVAPGKRTLTSRIPAQRAEASPVQRAAPADTRAGRPASPGDGFTAYWTSVAIRPDLHWSPEPGPAVQRRAADSGREDQPPGPAAAASSGARLPAAVQRKMEAAFSADFSAVRVHEGSHATAIGADAYTQGTDVHFAPGRYQPSSQQGQALLGHELAHVVQQRQGRVAATTRVGSVAVNDDASLEREADELGARAARGEALPAPSRASSPGAGVAAGQRRAASTPAAPGGPVQRAVKARKIGEGDSTSHDDLESICTKFGISKNALVTPMKDRLFAGNLFPDSYKNAYPNNRLIQGEVRKMVLELDDLIAAANVIDQIVAGAGDAGAVAAQLYHLIGPSINQQRLAQYDHYKILSQAGNGPSATYIELLDTMLARLQVYQNRIDHTKFDQQTRTENEKMENRLRVLRKAGRDLRRELDQALTQAQDTGPVIAKIRTLVDEIDTLEKAWDLDWAVDDQSLDQKVQDLANNENENLASHYQDDGGEDDGMSVGDNYSPLLACSLFSIIAVKGEWLGTSDPAVLHGILRKTGKLKDYDENATAAKVRYLAGLKPTAVGGMNLGAYIQNKKNRGEKDSFIADVAGIAHTFAAVWKNNDYKKVDETGSNGNLGEYANNEVLWIWK